MDGRAVVGLACAIAAACWVVACAAIVVARIVSRRRRAALPPFDTAVAYSPEWTHELPASYGNGSAHAASETREHLERGLRSPEPEVRRATVAALGRLGWRHEWAIDGLVEALAERRDVPARVAAELDRLAPRADTRLAPLLGHPNGTVRYYAARLLAREGNAGTTTPAPDLTGDPSPHVRAAALERLRGSVTGAALRLALRSLDDPHRIVRAEACRTASEISPRSAARFVAPLLADGSWEVREAARQALAKADRHAVAVVRPLLDHEDRAVARLAALVLRDAAYADELGSKGDASAREALDADGGRRFRALLGMQDVAMPTPEATA